MAADPLPLFRIRRLLPRVRAAQASSDPHHRRNGPAYHHPFVGMLDTQIGNPGVETANAADS